MTPVDACGVIVVNFFVLRATRLGAPHRRSPLHVPCVPCCVGGVWCGGFLLRLFSSGWRSDLELYSAGWKILRKSCNAGIWVQCALPIPLRPACNRPVPDPTFTVGAAFQLGTAPHFFVISLSSFHLLVSPSFFFLLRFHVIEIFGCCR